jgi:hypothetical protein
MNASLGDPAPFASALLNSLAYRVVVDAGVAAK